MKIKYITQTITEKPTHETVKKGDVIQLIDGKMTISGSSWDQDGLTIRGIDFRSTMGSARALSEGYEYRGECVSGHGFDVMMDRFVSLTRMIPDIEVGQVFEFSTNKVTILDIENEVVCYQNENQPSQHAKHISRFVKMIEVMHKADERHDFKKGQVFEFPNETITIQYLFISGKDELTWCESGTEVVRVLSVGINGGSGYYSESVDDFTKRIERLEKESNKPPVKLSHRAIEATITQFFDFINPDDLVGFELWTKYLRIKHDGNPLDSVVVEMLNYMAE